MARADQRPKPHRALAVMRSALRDSLEELALLERSRDRWRDYARELEEQETVERPRCDKCSPCECRCHLVEAGPDHYCLDCAERHPFERLAADNEVLTARVYELERELAEAKQSSDEFKRRACELEKREDASLSEIQRLVTERDDLGRRLREGIKESAA